LATYFKGTLVLVGVPYALIQSACNSCGFHSFYETKSFLFDAAA